MIAKKQTWIRFWTSLGVAGLLSLAGGTLRAEEELPGVAAGKQLFVRYCSLCHGVNARGHTDISELIRGETPDLTRIAARRKGWFPAVLVRELIDGRFTIHGKGKMPIWGHALDTSELIALTEYLHSIQVE